MEWSSNINRTAGKRITRGDGGLIFNNHHIRGKTNRAPNAQGAAKLSPAKPKIIPGRFSACRPTENIGKIQIK